MATNPPDDEQIVLIRGSEEHQSYLKHQFGHIKGWVNAFETRIAVAGRAFLLIYVAYITIKAGAGVIHIEIPPQAAGVVNVLLFLLDIFMLALQVLGLEGSVPGLVHLADEMENQGKTKEAESIRSAADTAQFLMAATAIDVVLQYMPHVLTIPGYGPIDITWFAFAFDKILFVVRVIVIGRYLKAMARLENKGPKIISQAEYDRQQHEAEQEQIRMDNTAIQNSINQALSAWSTEQECRFISLSTKLVADTQATQASLSNELAVNQEKQLLVIAAELQKNIPVFDTEALLQQVEATLNQKTAGLQQAIEAELSKVKQQVEAGQGASSTDSEALFQQVEAALNQKNASLTQVVEAELAGAKQQTNQEISELRTLIVNEVARLQRRMDKALSEATPKHTEGQRGAAPEKRAMLATHKASEAGSSKILSINQNLSREEVLQLIEADLTLLQLSDRDLARRVGSTPSTAGRAKNDYKLKHPEALQDVNENEDEAGETDEFEAAE